MTSTGRTAAAELRQVGTGAERWIAVNLDRFDPCSDGTRAIGWRRVKAALELAVLCRCARRLSFPGPWLGDATQLLKQAWSDRALRRLIVSARPDIARHYALAYLALDPHGAPAPVPSEAVPPEAVPPELAVLAAEGLAELAAGPPDRRLEARFYAELAGLPHDLEPCGILAGQGVLAAQQGTAQVTLGRGYTITHSCFYLSDFASRPPALSPAGLARALECTQRLQRQCADGELWDLAAEALLACACVGGDPVSTPAGQAAIRSLALAQAADGSIPGRSAAQRPPAGAGTAERFAAAYHTTLAAAMMSLVLAAKADEEGT
jgi:hypothetical protein